MARKSDLTLIEASEVSKSFGGVNVLAGASFEIKAGDFIVLRGGNGSGKTTLLNILSGLLAPDEGSIAVHRSGKCTAKFGFGRSRIRERHSGRFSLTAMARQGVLRSWQDIRLFSSLSLVDNLNVAAPDEFGERLLPALFRPFAVRERQQSATLASTEMLGSFGLEHLTDRNGLVKSDVSQRAATGINVSLGEAKRVAMARACRGDSRLLLLDEPLSGLDARGIRSVVRLLSTLNRQRGLAILVVEHESTVEHLAGLANETWSLESGRISRRYSGVVSEDQTAFLERWKLTVKRERETERTIQLPNGARLTIIAPPDVAPRDGLTINNVSVVREGRSVLPRLSMKVPRGALGIVEAPNGWGKTSLVEALAGLLPVHSGELLLDGVNLGKEEPWIRRRRGLTLLQSRGVSFPKLTVGEALRVCEVELVPSYLIDLVDRTVSSLSGGERQRLLFACSRGGPLLRLTLWDEPFVGLDQKGVELLTRTVLERSEDQTIIVFLPAAAQNVQEDPMEES